MRVFAGPNGSGKTTIVKNLMSEVPFGIYVNADDIEKIMHQTKVLLFDSYNLKVQQEELQTFFRNSTFAPVKRNEPNLWEKLTVKDNLLHTTAEIDSYLAADIAEFIRQRLLHDGQSFTYETVMSHEGKIDFLKRAQELDCRVYLYYVATEDPEINVSRVKLRVAQDGHNVKEEDIRNRYYKSLKQLKSAVKLSNRAYIFDNSGKVSLLIAEVTDGEDVTIIDTKVIPNWLVTYLVN
ncbi:AAA family ATPase [Flavobacterium sp.]|uniref:AAA family ATPase n=1 Tax=Flavobacterium sp. TaxID=239 RepID=UPI0022BF04D2|nr:AAA family ATPase [Flavobacterium sp.]MCZ8169185.1 AAA family ATPase [Flavobacterium sp.]MCZ8297758.1 AAA family ATPase [Flavobacterium sp.]